MLVHCLHGVNRSATTVMAILMLSEGVTLSEAYAHTKKQRAQVQCNAPSLHWLDEAHADLVKRAPA